MAEDKVEVRDVNFRQVLPWTELFRSFQVALDPKKLLLAAAGILIMACGWWLLALLFYNTQTKPDAGSQAYDQSHFRINNPNLKPDEIARQERKAAWEAFKEDRHKWNILHQTAGTLSADSKEWHYTDAGDLAGSPDEYDAIKDDVNRKIKELQAAGLSKGSVVAANGKSYELTLKPYGALRSWPFFENRGPNPYLLVTGQAGTPWVQGQFGEWLLRSQLPVLIEPLVKFLSPVVYLLSPRAGALNRFYFLLVTLWTLATWALFGGAITRMAAVQVARNDKVSLGEAVRFVTQRYLSFLSAPIFPLLFVAFIVVVLTVYGLLYMIPVFGDIVVAGLGWPLVLLAGLAMAVVLVGLVGWPMMYATISAEGSDSFDAISRSYSYVYQNPWHYVWYSLVALAYGAVVVFFVGFMGSMIVYLGKWGVSQTPFVESADRDPSFLFVYAPTSFDWRTLLLQGATVDGDPIVRGGAIDPVAYNKFVATFSWWNIAGTVLVTAWIYLFFLLILGFAYSYFWTASTVIYLLMRRKVDDTDMDEVYLEEDDLDETYSTSTKVPAGAAPAGASAGTAAGTTVMVDAPTLRTSAPPPAPAASPVVSTPASSPAVTTPATPVTPVTPITPITPAAPVTQVAPEPARADGDAAGDGASPPPTADGDRS